MDVMEKGFCSECEDTNIFRIELSAGISCGYCKLCKSCLQKAIKMIEKVEKEERK